MIASGDVRKAAYPSGRRTPNCIAVVENRVATK